MSIAENLLETVQCLTFRLAEECYGIDVLKVREILDVVPVTKVPRSPEFMLGVINLRGHVVPVVDLRRRFGIARADQSKDTCIIVLEVELEGEGITLGILGDMVEEVVDLRADQIEPAPRIGSSLRTEFIRGIGKQGDDFIILLDIDKIFTREELSTVTAGSDVSTN